MPDCPTVVWRRLDRPGREAATVRKTRSGWQLFGVVELEYDGMTVCLSHVTTCSRSWQTRECEIAGFIGDKAVMLHIQRDFAGRWSLGGRPAPDVAGCDDIDLAFSPITNLLPIRRLALPVGAAAQVRAAWLRFPELGLEPLEQTYTRLSRNRYQYESGGGEFRRVLTVDDSGVVLHYPGLWIADDDECGDDSRLGA
jgi:hypothetical protein